MKTCTKCNIEKPDSDFNICKRDGLQFLCKQCKAKHFLENKEASRARMRARYEKNRPQILEEGRLRRKDPVFNAGTNLRRRCRNYGITVEQYHEMLKTCDNRCNICKCELTSTPAIDHSHVTYEVRGLLCDNCNTALGLLKESVEVLQSAISYLNKYKK